MSERFWIGFLGIAVIVLSCLLFIRVPSIPHAVLGLAAIVTAVYAVYEMETRA